MPTKLTIDSTQRFHMYDTIRDRIRIVDGRKTLPDFDGLTQQELAELVSSWIDFNVSKSAVQAAIQATGATYRKPTNQGNPLLQSLEASNRRIELLDERIDRLDEQLDDLYQKLDDLYRHLGSRDTTLFSVKQ